MSNTIHHLVLVGLSGSGKTTVGPAIAQALHRPLYDTDQIIIAQHDNRPIAEIIVAHEPDGKEYFREYETNTLTWALAQASSVIICGGGIVLREQNRRILRASSALVVRLDSNDDVLLARVAQSGEERPWLTGVSIAAMRAERDPLYDEVTDIRLDTTHLTPQQVIAQVVAAYEDHTSPK